MSDAYWRYAAESQQQQQQQQQHAPSAITGKRPRPDF
ncbi:hypothetical protein A2U01_0020873, partial [Trifolium medium]|nr:hypothetical protein [Trifolium medium]